ncbi:MAG: hypothetical protein WBE13_00090 [Candidatus Acidiferrum sp.]
MRKGRYALVLFVAVVWIIALSNADSQEPASGGGAAHMVVTAEAHHGKDVPDVHKEDVMLYQGKERRQVADWTPLRDEHAALQLFILLDDSSHVSVASQFEEIRNFINSQPPTTAIGIGYMRDGTVDITQNLTTEHSLAAKALRLPLGRLGAFASIYLSIGDLIKRWPETPVRRELLVISDGIDYFGGVGPANPYVDTAIEQAQKAGIIVYAIYATGVGHYGHSLFRMNWGQNYLSEMAEETGGDAYFLGYETPVSFGPYLDDISQRLTHQYLLVFQAKPEKKPGLQSVRLRTELPNVELAAADRVFVPAEK